MLRNFALLFAATVVAANLSMADVLPPPAALTLENVPPVPLELVAEVGRYTESRTATFASWHPTANAMLISTRFANTLQIHSVAMAGGARRQLTFFAEPIRSASYDPAEGAFIIYGRDIGGGEFSQLYRMDLADGRSTLLTDGGRSQNAISAWSPDDRRFAYGSTRRNGTDRDIHIMDPRDPSSNRLVCENVGGGWSATDWSPDGTTLLMIERVSVNESFLWLVDIATGARTELTPREAGGISRGNGMFSRDGKGVYLTTDEVNEFKRLAYMDLATRETTFLTSGIDHDVSGFSLSDDGRRLVFRVDRLGVGELYLMDTATRTYSKVEGIPVGVISGGSWHKNNRHIAFNLNNAHSTSDVYMLDADTAEIVRWTESELGGINAAELRDAELIHWRSFDEREISGFYFRPAQRFTGKRPVIINIHGGPEGQALPVFQARSNYLLNELGVAIIYPNVRGSTGFGKTFVALDNGRLREDSVRDIGALLDWVAQQSDLDASRVMITGGSYGGYMTLACAVNYNDRIRCSLDVVGISNFVTFLENTESYRRDLRRVEYGDERDPEIRAILQSISPLNHAEKIQKPIFVVQGANDPRVPKTEAHQMVASIREAGGQAWYMEAADEGHGFAKKVNSDYQFYSTVQFIRAHLLN
jgi:dipeptidyl aminopeptidase/acylaminoacyl peptidase